MNFRLVPKSVTLDDLEQSNGCVVCVISPNSVAFGTDYVKVVEDTPTHSASEIAQNVFKSSKDTQLASGTNCLGEGNNFHREIIWQNCSEG